MAVELIEFTRPSKDDVNLYVTNISPLLDVEEIEVSSFPYIQFANV